MPAHVDVPRRLVVLPSLFQNSRLSPDGLLWHSALL
jgi:hypothetical protein